MSTRRQNRKRTNLTNSSLAQNCRISLAFIRYISTPKFTKWHRDNVKIKKTNNLSNLKTSIFCEICHKMFTFFTSKLNSNTFPSNSHGGKPKTQLDFSATVLQCLYNESQHNYCLELTMAFFVTIISFVYQCLMFDMLTIEIKLLP